MKFHPNCNYVATGSSDKTVRLWDVQTGECVRIFIGHHGGIQCLAFSRDGKYCASAGEDKQIMIWDIASGKVVNTLKGHTDDILTIEFNEKGNLIASGSLDNTLRVWNLKQSTNKYVYFYNIFIYMYSTFYTKQTPIYKICFEKDIILGAGPFEPQI